MSLIQNKNGIDKINKKNIVYAGGAYAALDRDAEKQETKQTDTGRTPMMTFLLIIHGLIAVALLGGITHQTFAACWPARRKAGFFTSFRAVAGTRYTNANIVLYLAAATLGGIIYSSYRITVRLYLESARLWSANGAFEVKEQFVAVGLGMLPLFWWVWREPLDPAKAGTRAAVTAILCFIVWYSFLTGHVLNNIRGLFGQ